MVNYPLCRLYRFRNAVPEREYLTQRKKPNQDREKTRNGLLTSDKRMHNTDQE